MRVFVTGASGWIGSAVVPELLAAGHQVVGLARSDASAEALSAAGAEVQRGSLDDLDALRAAANKSDGVIHLAFNHEIAFTGGFQEAADSDRRAIETFGEVLAGSDRPFLIASGMLGLNPGQVAAEKDGHDAATAAHLPGGPKTRWENAEMTLGFASKGVRSSILRLPPTCHGEGDNGFMKMIVGFARANGVSPYIGDGNNHWPATHRLDVATAFRLALEKAPAGSTLHPAAEQGVTIRSIAEAIGRDLDLPVTSISPEDAPAHFNFLAAFIGVDCQASSAFTRELLGWNPTHAGLIEDLNEGHYFKEA